MSHAKFPILATVFALSLTARAGTTADDCSTGTKPEWNADERAAAAADCQFYKDSLVRRAEAWSAAAAEDGVTGPLVGRDAIRKSFEKAYTQPEFRLVWHPDAAKQLSPGFVVTSGPWERRGPDGKGVTADSHGRYVTVWQRQADGAWRYAWDGGEELKDSTHRP